LVWDTTQAPVVIRNGLADMLGLSERQVRVIAPFIGGGFGPKIMMFYQEEVLVPWAAMKLNRPVKWIEDRAENFVATTHERGQIHDAEIAFDMDGRILGVHDVFWHDTGAYAPYGLTVPLNACTLAIRHRKLLHRVHGFSQQDHRHTVSRCGASTWRVRHRARVGHCRERIKN
jgi:CO/xanthine dehydrogenase Mo-binding subunit